MAGRTESRLERKKKAGGRLSTLNRRLSRIQSTDVPEDPQESWLVLKRHEWLVLKRPVTPGPGSLSPSEFDPVALRWRREQRASQYLFKEDLQRLVDRLGIEIRVAHYPPYCSKYNPIEHRLFPHLSRACQGVIFESVELVKELMEKAKTNTGLQVRVDILDKVYQTGRKYAEGFM